MHLKLIRRQFQSLLLLLLLALGCWGAWSSSALTAQELPQQTVQVFILAGQSNMQGHGVVDLLGKDYNGGRGSLVRLMRFKKNKKLFSSLTDSDGSWRSRKDVFIRYQTENTVRKGNLTIGFTGYENDRHHFGPELAFGHAVGRANVNPVLLIKTAWGGKSLYKDFRPPSSGGEVGPYYTKMMEQIDFTLENLATEFPQLAHRKPVVAGFVWQQGWNDMVDEAATKEYEKNLLNLIKDVRNKFKNPELPFVYGELGNGGKTGDANMYAFRAAQELASTYNDPFVRYVPTADFARPADESPNPTHLHHWYGNAESYFLLGKALGESMNSMTKRPLPKVLLIGDSISMGYTETVKSLLSSKADVYRAANPKGKRENCRSSKFGYQNIDRWLKLHGGKWELIHFNFGLHDIKHRGPDGKASMDPKDPMWVSPSDYEQNLNRIISKLKKTNSKLVFAMTTPVPDGVKPYRNSKDVETYNLIARKVMDQHGIEINDLYTFAEERLDDIQRPNDVHFTPVGSVILGEQVSKEIWKRLKTAETAD